MQKRISKLLLALCLMAVMLPMAASAETSGVAINETNFPDKNFRSYVSTNFDTDGNGSLSDKEIANVTAINVNYSEIASLQGIEYFTALTSLSCWNNKLTELDVSKNTLLRTLYFGNNVGGDQNQIKTLDITNNTRLTELNCGKNLLTELDVSKNTELIYLYCHENQLTTLDVSKNTKLIILDCYDNDLTMLNESSSTRLQEINCNNNKITKLDVSKNTALMYLYCSSNQLSELDVSDKTNLKNLNCNNNELTALDVSGCTALESIYCDENQLKSLDVRTNTALKNLYCRSNQLAELDLSNNAALEALYCGNYYLGQNQLTSLDLSNTAVKYFSCDSCEYEIDLDSSRRFALWSLPGKFDVNKASDWTGGTVSGTTLTVDDDAEEVTYTYDCGNDLTATFTLTISDKVVAMPTATPTPTTEPTATPTTSPTATATPTATPTAAPTASPTASPTETPTEQVFSDVSTKSWYYSNVMKAYEKGYMSGTGDGEFSPNATLTREQMVQILYNMEGKPAVSTTTSQFTDVKAGQWYTNAIIWATENDVVSGYSSTKFGVGDKVTREQMAQMFYNYIVKYLKTDASKVTGDGIAKFKDASSVSSWAKTAMNWAANGGIMNGSDGKVNPLGTATRAEAASVLVNFDKFMEKYGG